MGGGNRPTSQQGVQKPATWRPAVRPASAPPRQGPRIGVPEWFQGRFPPAGASSATATPTSEPLVTPRESLSKTFEGFRMGIKHLGQIGKAKLLREFKQNNYIPVPDGPYSKRIQSGVCDALCLQWMAHSADGKDFWSYITSRDGVANTIDLQTRSNSASEFGGFVDKKERERKALKNYEQKMLGLPKDQRNKQVIDGMLDVRRKLNHELETIKDAWPAIVGERANFRSEYLREHSKLTRLGDKATEYDTVKAACDKLRGFEGYVHVKSVGSKSGHAICVYISDNHVRIMDPNHGEIFVSDPRVATVGLQSHLDDFFRPSRLGEFESISLDFYPEKQRPRGAEGVDSPGREKIDNDNADKVEMSFGNADAVELSQSSRDDAAGSAESIANSNNG